MRAHSLFADPEPRPRHPLNMLSLEQDGFMFRAVVAPCVGHRFSLVVFGHAGAVLRRGRAFTRRGGVRRVTRWMNELALAQADQQFSRS